MKLVGFIVLAFVLVVIGAFTWLALTDVPVQQKDIAKVISNDRFYKQATR